MFYIFFFFNHFLGAASPKPDFDPTHQASHPMGGGSWWYEGITKMMDLTYEKIQNPAFPIITEANAENSLDNLHGLLTLTIFYAA